MIANRSYLVALIAASALVVTLISPDAEGRQWQRVRSVSEITSEPAPLLLGAPQADTVQVYFEDFADGTNGWEPRDLMVQDPYWHPTRYFDGSDSVGVMWCGADDPSWVSPPGYGSMWSQCLSKSFALPSAPVSVTYRIQYDTSPLYDYVYLDVSGDGGTTYTTLEALTGNSEGLLVMATDLSAFAGKTATLRFRFVSVPFGNDEDGYYDSDGAARLDWIQVTGGGVDDFETGYDGWVAIGHQPSPVQFRLVETPACDAAWPCPGYTYTWVAYDPATGKFPFDPVGGNQELAIESPAIDIPAEASNYIMDFDVYCNLPSANLVYFTWEVAAPPPEQGGAWESDGGLWECSAGWGFHHSSVDITRYVSEGITQIKVRLCAVALPGGVTHTAAPMFDNIGISAVLGGQVDEDGDGVNNRHDDCPTQNSSFFDFDGNGCLDDLMGGRHVEYWDASAFPVPFVINEDGAPNISDGSEFTAVQSGFSAWTSIPDVEASVHYSGTTAQDDAQALDQVNLVTFNDPDYHFGIGVLAVGVTTSFTEPTDFNGQTYRPGQIVDADMIFNPIQRFRTATNGPADGTYIEAVATHEAGHFFGISHSAVRSSVMYFVLPPGLEAATLKPEDKLAMYKAYGNEFALWTDGWLYGYINDGYTNARISGAAVFVLDAATGDTVACDYTYSSPELYQTFQGRFFFPLPAGQYYLAVHPLDGSSAIGYMEPAYVNDLIANTASTNFSPDWWNTGEPSNVDDPSRRDPLTITQYFGTYARIRTNIDNVRPVVKSTVPAANATGVSVGGSILVGFSEPINETTLQGNFKLTDVPTGTFVSGNAVVLNDDSLVAFVPEVGLAFSTQYKLRLETGLKDKFNNGLAQAFQMFFTTEPEPPVALTSLAPSKGVAGIVVSVNGKGFDPLPANNTVTFSGLPAVVSQASPTQLVVTVPDGATSGIVNVYNHTQGQMSNDLQFTVLSSDEVPKGFDFGISALTATPRALAVLPNGSYAYMATDAGAQAVIVDPALGDYLSSVAIPIAGGLTDIAAAPTGTRVYGVSYATEKIYRISSVPGSIGLLSEKAIGATPRGILIHPLGHRGYIPTYDGDIQVWDLNEASPTFMTQVGQLVPPDPNIRGKLAADPAGDLLLALTGTGKLLVFNLNSHALVATVKVGPDPRDVVVDPRGNPAYVCDESGTVSVVSLTNFTCLKTIRAGGSLRGIAVTPAGGFVYAVNREMNLLDAIDLRETSPAFATVVATIPLPVNPVGIELSPDGDYAFTISEAEDHLVVTTVGLGPGMASVSRPAGPVGSKLVIAGSDLAGTVSTAVSFGDTLVAPDIVSDNVLTVTVPAGVATGKVSVVTTDTGKPPQTSNSAYFEVLGPTLQDQLRLAATLPGTPSQSGDGGSVLTISPAGGVIALADNTGGLHILTSNPASPNYHKYAGSVNLGSIVGDVEFAPNGQCCFAVLPTAKVVKVIGANPLRSDFLSTLATIDFSGTPGSSPANVAVSPGGSLLIVSDPGANQVHLVDIAAGSANQYQIVASPDLASGNINGTVREMAFHPAGASAYLPVQDTDPAVVLVLDAAAASPTYGTVVASATLPGSAPQEVPISLAFTPDGARCLVLTSEQVGTPHRSVVMLNTVNPVSPTVAATLSIGGTAPPVAEHIDVSPRGDRAVAGISGLGLVNISIQTSPDALAIVQQFGQAADHLTTVGTDFTPQASRFYCLSESSDNLLVYDYSTAQAIAILSGNGQAGVVNEPLPLPLRALVSGGSAAAAGVLVTFSVTSGGGHFVANGDTVLVVVTNADGVAAARWVLGPAAGAGAQTVEAIATGLTGSPLTFVADGLPDPTTLPLTVSSVVPPDGTTDVSVATAVQAAFSRPVDPASVTSQTFALVDGGSNPVAATIGFADGNRKVSLSPRAALEATTGYSIEIGTGILDEAGGALTQAVSTSFTTEQPPPVALHSISPPSGPEGITVVLSGTGFSDAVALNRVLFGTRAAYVSASGKDFANAVVPVGATTGPVRLTNAATADTSNPLTFTVLPPAAPRTNDVVANIATGTGTHGVAITPDGAFAYALSPYANRVVVINLIRLAFVTSIPVGDNPVAITIDPQGAFAYVANYLDGTVSIIDVHRDSPTFNEVVDAIPVGVGPLDLAVTPDGDRLIVVNSGSDDLSVVDTDSASETYRSVVASVATGSGTSTVAITPDGGLLYVGTANGYLVISATDYGVVASVATGSGTSTVAITPDGAFLVILTTEGVVNIYDIQEGSLSENQVVASIQTGSGTSTVAITPDGGLLYLIQRAGDVIFVVALYVTPGVGVVDNGADMPPVKLTATIVDTLAAGEDPSGIAFDPTGSDRFIVTNAGDGTITVFGLPVGPATLTGHVLADCPAPGTGLLGVKIDAFTWGVGDLAATMLTDANGQYSTSLAAGDYVLTLVTPLGYSTACEETLKTLRPGETTSVDFALHCETVVPDPRKMSFWKHELGLALSGKGQPEIDGPTLCSYLDLIEDHFNSNLLNPVVVYVPPASGACSDKLQVAKDILNLEGRREQVSFARQELLALLFNVAGAKLALAATASLDGRTVSQAITFADHLIDDGVSANDQLATKIVKDINQGKMIAGGVIPSDTPNIMYIVRIKDFDLAQNSPNPFSGSTLIQFAVPQTAEVRLGVYDVGGRLVKRLVDGRREPGLYKVAWDGTDAYGRHVASGVYFSRFEAGDFIKTRKMLVVR